MSARVRRIAPVSGLEEDEDALLTPVTPAAPTQVPREDAEGGESVREAVGDGREETRSEGGGSKEGGDEEKGRGDEEVTHVEELKAGELMTSAELESDSSFQNTKEEKEEIF